MLCPFMAHMTQILVNHLKVKYTAVDVYIHKGDLDRFSIRVHLNKVEFHPHYTPYSSFEPPVQLYMAQNWSIELKTYLSLHCTIVIYTHKSDLDNFSQSVHLIYNHIHLISYLRSQILPPSTPYMAPDKWFLIDKPEL